MKKKEKDLENKINLGEMVDYEGLSVTEIVDKIINKAIKLDASDIHFESLENCLKIRFRLDGILHDYLSLSKELSDQITSKIKILSNLDISQRRIPQDGKFKIFYNNNHIDLRVSTFPSIYGEKIVIRILDRLKTSIELEDLGFASDVLIQFKELISKSNGFILVTGPTGSGKTTTLYAALSYINDPSKNIITLEDPVEYHIDGVTQSQINLGSGFTFAKGIRSLLRQDPDIAMIGEIRDIESAKIAIEASLTGHLVFSTLHTNNAPSAIIRLMDMNIEPYLINSSLTGILAQRLARKICNHCKEQIHTTKLLEVFGRKVKNLFQGKGCDNCNEIGYKGRIGIFELLIISEDLRTLIINNPKFDKITNQAIKDGMKTLIDDGIQKVNNGIITLDELLRVIS